MGQKSQENLIGLLLGPGPRAVVGILGVLKSGCGFVPIDPEYPPERIGFILDDCGIKTLLTEAKYTSLAWRVAKKNTPLEHIICLDAVESAERETNGIDVYDCGDYEGESPAEQEIHTEQDQTVYVVYTSGSTGMPKGVPIAHQNLIPMLLWGREHLKLGEHSKTLQSLSYCFDFGLFEILSTLLFGGTLYFMGKDQLFNASRYTQYVNEREINTINSTPSFFKMLAALGAKLETLELLHLGGEELTNDALDEIFATVGERCIVHNGYGPTEATITSSIFEVGRRSNRRYKESNSVPIGKVSANNRLYVLDKNCQPVPVGVPGELHVGGMGLSRGYLNRPGLAAEKFVPNPFGDEPGTRLYKTGDLVRYLSDGNLEFLGRFDHQVKMRGFRIELGEIEAVLRRQLAVREAVVLVQQGTSGEKRLVAYVVPGEEQAPSTGQLRDFLKARLPDYMIPSAFVALETLPLTPNGKVDRRALLAPEETGRESTKAFVAPRTALEKVLANMWSQLLGLERVGVDDDFFELGGHSLLATQVASRVSRIFRTELPLRDFFAATTVAHLAGAIMAAESKPGQSERIAQMLKKVESLSPEQAQAMLYQKRKMRHAN